MRKFPLFLSFAALIALTAVAAEPSAVLNDFGGVTQVSDRASPDRVEPFRAPLGSEATKARSKAVAWLINDQKSDGGWGSGGHGTSGQGAASDVATTAFAVLALHRDASRSRLHDSEIRRGVEFIVRAVETAPEGPRLATPEGTQIQTKLGPLVDTHLAALTLGEVVGSLDGSLATRARHALEKTVRKIELAQNGDGSFDGNAWAPVLSSSIASQGLYSAEEAGIRVDTKVLAKSDDYQAATGNVATGSFDTSAGAGVELYAVASALRGTSQTADRKGANAAAPAVEAEARAVNQLASGRVSSNADSLIAGFGSVGGEEMLSYMMISDTLAEKGGEEWRAWSDKIGTFLASAQSADGSWVGHHCITSQSFATAGGILTLSAGDHAANQPSTRG